MFIEKLNAGLAPKNLLNHRFYQLWIEGKLDRNILADYAQQYYSHVEAFPRYISLIHSQCSDIEDRQVLLENLIEEERGPENHPKLWSDFASELGIEDLVNVKQHKTTEFLVDKFFDLCKRSYAAGLGALYAYEHQTPAIAETKIKGLKEFYGITSEKGLKFFEVHKSADVWHSQEVADLLVKLSYDDKVEAFSAASQAADALWSFLDGIMITHNLDERSACSN